VLKPILLGFAASELAVIVALNLDDDGGSDFFRQWPTCVTRMVAGVHTCASQ
jgi:hypothetical protein